MSGSSGAMRRGMAQCGVAAVLFGAATPAAAKLGERLPAFTLAGLLYLGAGLAMAPLAWRHRPQRTAARREAPRLAAAVLFGGMLGPVLLMLALDRAPSSTVSLLLNLEVVFTVVLAAVWFHEHLGPRVVAGTVAVASAGVLLGWSGDVDLRIGAALAAAACACWAVDNTVTADLATFTPAQITLTKGAVAGTANLVIGLTASGGAEAGAVPWALVVGALGYGVSIMLWISGARALGAARGQLIFAVAPFVGAALSWWLLDEAVSARAVVAMVIAGAGVALVMRSSHTHAHEHEALDHDHEHTHDDGHHDHAHPDGFTGRHAHPHHHEHLVHAHPHVPDLHHKHTHHDA